MLISIRSKSLITRPPPFRGAAFFVAKPTLRPAEGAHLDQSPDFARPFHVVD